MNRVVVIHTPVGFTRQGRASKNEDYILPTAKRATDSDRLFLVCDGEGSEQQGELASLLAAETLQAYMRTHPTEHVDVTYLQGAINAVEKAFDRAIREEVEANLAGMSTTLTLLSLHQRGVTIAHIGDSRVYHIRAGQILYQIPNNRATSEQAVLTQSIQGSKLPAKPDVYETQDVAADDYFFLCTAGFLEAFTSTDLAQTLLSRTLTDRQKVAVLLDQCAEQSTDNYSGYMIHVAAVESLSELPGQSPIRAERVSTPENSMETFQYMLSEGEEALERENRNWFQRMLL
ncbi:PP2C family protein-serine/threonine phosphatase [Fibrivirga algicola]|uniref:PPM-type phosphatase domain-containing protein n=1 Tax=Fibrivirga algicola TaxID=2950420 RepID=A0ABX0QBG4_9BACT|nr:protein phosphatase 2C domain-containing protein [Fibrivirga algicola]NID09439.1 hypothetical protein [Fibrivirga algicola]